MSAKFEVLKKEFEKLEENFQAKVKTKSNLKNNHIFIDLISECTLFGPDQGRPTQFLK